MLPATGSDPLLDLTGAGRDGSGGRSYRPSLPPFVDIGRKLDAVDDVELFTVDSEVADYWRIAALDQYSPANGGNWTLSAQGDDSVAVGLPETAPADALQQEFRIGPLGERWLPAAYKPVAINLPDTLVVRSSDTIVADADSVSDLRYTVASELPVLSTSQVTAAQIAATDRPVPEELRRYTVLPRTADMTEIATRARRLVDNSGATTPYARALVLRDWFRNPANGFRYDTSVGSFDNGDAILQFLDDQRGFCVQFASAYAVMARSLGIPARVAVGFTPGRRDGNRFRVTSHDAHAWPEVYLSGLGWTHLFDPTPSARDTTTGGSALPNETGVAGTSGSTVPPPTVATAPPPTTPGASSGADQSQAPAGAPPQTLAPAPVSSGSDGGPWLLLLSLVALLAAAIGAYVGIVLTVKRHRRARRRGAGDPALAVTGAWHEALDRLHEASIDPRPEQTPLDVADALPARAAAAATDPMRALARTYGAARYGDGAVDPDDARDAWGSLEQLERALDADLSWRGRWRRRLDARTLVRR
jgi:transglutaminase-like putative cysteine protease